MRLLLAACLVLASCTQTDPTPQVTPDATPPASDVSQDVTSTAEVSGTDTRAETSPELPPAGDVADTTGPEPEPETMWREACPADAPETRMVNTGEVNLHVACQGDGPTVVFLHGFPEFWFSWHKVMDLLAADYRLVAPDQRGYNLSDKPPEVSDYQVAHLVNDIAGLVDVMSEGPVVLVAHDWGGPVAWTLTHLFPERIRGLVIVNGPHPNVLADLLQNDPDQQAASSYVGFFRGATAEGILSANDFAMLAGFFAELLTDDEMAAYKAAWGQEGALTGGLNWYRANDLSTGFGDTPITIEVPTLVLWGLDDTALLPQNVNGLEAYVSDLEVKTYEDISHWVSHEMPDELAAEIAAFAAALP